MMDSGMNPSSRTMVIWNTATGVIAVSRTATDRHQYNKHETNVNSSARDTDSSGTVSSPVTATTALPGRDQQVLPYLQSGWNTLSQFWHFSSDSKKYLAHLPAASHFSNHSRCQNNTEEMQANINVVVYTTQEGVHGWDQYSNLKTVKKLQSIPIEQNLFNFLKADFEMGTFLLLQYTQTDNR